jgi:hypothetical protein
MAPYIQRHRPHRDHGKRIDQYRYERDVPVVDHGIVSAKFQMKPDEDNVKRPVTESFKDKAWSLHAICWRCLPSIDRRDRIGFLHHAFVILTEYLTVLLSYWNEKVQLCYPGKSHTPSAYKIVR